MTKDKKYNDQIATKQAISPISKTPPPPENQFGKPGGNPRHNGAWRKEDSARFKLEQMIKMDYQELENILQDMNAPVFERRIAKSLLQEDGWKITESMIDQVYGKPKEQKKEIEVTSNISEEQSILETLRQMAEEK